MKHPHRFLIAPLTTLAFLLLLIPPTLAIGIRPIRSEFSVLPGESVTGEVTVLNETEVDFKAEPVIKVFYKNDETGFPAYPSPEELNETENFREWIELPQDPLTIPAQGSATVSYTVKVPKNATAGGKYATLAYQPVRDPNGGVAVNVRAASLLFVNVEGEVIKQGQINRFALPETLKTSEPFRFETTFENTGNTHIKPYGWIEIKDKQTGKKLTQMARYIDETTGKEVLSDALPVNLRQKNVLPGSTRTFPSEWMEGLKEGEFEATLKLKYGEETSSVSQILNFEIKEEIRVDQFLIHSREGSADFNLTLSNHGRAEEKPRGAIKIRNNLGYQVAEVPLPEDLAYLAPGETVSLNLPWLKQALPAGRYKASLEARYGFTGKLLEAELRFGQMDRVKLGMGIALGFALALALGAIFWKGRRGKRNRK